MREQGRARELSEILRLVDELASTGAAPAADPSALVAQLRQAVASALGQDAAVAGDACDIATLADPQFDVRARERVLHQVGLAPTCAVTVFAVDASPGPVETFIAGVRKRCAVVHHAALNGLELIIARDLPTADALDVPTGARVGFSGPRPAIEVPEGWRLARLALRFAKPSPREHGPYLLEEAVAVDAGELGGYALLADSLTTERISAVEDVRRLDRLVAKFGAEMLVCLEAVAATDSLRKAAGRLHLHHNSVAHRVERAENSLGFSFTEPYGRTRLFLALVLRRLQETSAPPVRSRQSFDPSGEAAAPPGR